MRRERAIICLVISTLLCVVLRPRLGVSAQTESRGQAKTTTLRVAGIPATVTIRRDERGIAYIEAPNEDSLYFAQGYVTASDRLWQMDLLRRTGRGELSEIFGRDVLEEDKHYRTYGFSKVVEAALAKSSPTFRAVLESFARGVNAFIDSQPDKSLAPEFQLLKYRPRPWQPADSLVIGKTFSVTLSTSWETDITREAFMDLPRNRRDMLFPEASPLDVVLVGSDKAGKKTAHLSPPHQQRRMNLGDETFAAISRAADIARRPLERVGLYAEDLAASNNWVVSGKRTASGKPLLANDPHLPPSAPSIWHMTHLSAPGVRVAGVAIPGVPGVTIGHNEQIAWGVTNLGADVQDLYVESFDPNNARRYKTPAGWREAEVRREEIKVRNSFADPTTGTVVHEATVTRHGPIIFEADGKRYALRWTALDTKSIQLEAFYHINRARDWNEFRAALKNYTEPAQNFVYADVNGHIGYYAAGEIPIRKTGDGSIPYDGSADEGEWVGFIPFDKLPHLYDPPSGIIVTANNRTVGLDFPHAITREWAQPYRARRIFDLLQAKRKLTVDDFRAIQGDTYSFAGATFAREVVKTSLESARADNDLKWLEALRGLEAWDGHVNPNSRGTLLLSEMRNAFRRRILKAALGADRWQKYAWSNSDTFIDRIVTERPREWLPAEFKDYAELFRASFMDAGEILTQRLGADESLWQWERAPYTQVRFPHPFSEAPLIGQRFRIDPFPQSGSYSSLTTVNVGPRVSLRFIADASDWDKTRMGIPLGQSGNPASPHWKDQLEDWRAVTPRVFPFSKGEVAEATKQMIMLGPAAEGR